MKTYYEIRGETNIPEVLKFDVEYTTLTDGGVEVENDLDDRFFTIDDGYRQRPISEESFNYFKKFYQKKVHSIYYFNPNNMLVRRVIYDKDNKNKKRVFDWNFRKKKWEDYSRFHSPNGYGYNDLVLGWENELPVYKFHLSKNEAMALINGDRKLLQTFFDGPNIKYHYSEHYLNELLNL